MTAGTASLYGVTYCVATNMPHVDAQIDEEINFFILQSFDRAPVSQQKAHLYVHFFIKPPLEEKRKTKWFGKSSSPSKSQLGIWELWDICVKCLAPVNQSPTGIKLTNDLSVLMQTSIRSFHDAILSVTDIIDSYKEHIPPITLLDSAPFSFSITSQDYLSSEEDDKDNNAGWGTYIKKMLD